MLRRTQSVALKDDDTGDEPRQEAPRSILRNDARQRIEKLRGEYERPSGAAPAEPPAGEAEPAAEARPILPQRPSVPDRVRNGGLDALRTEYQRSLLTPSEEEAAPLGNALKLFSVLRPSRIILLVVALLAGGLAAWLAVSRPAEPVPAAAPAAAVEVREVKAPTAEVLVAKVPIGIGQTLTPDNLEWQEWPESAVRSEFITQASQPEALTSMNTSLARSAFFAGEPIRAEKLAPVGEGLLASILAPGMRGVSVSVSADSAAGGFVAPDDHVDVLLTRTTPTGQSVETILNNVRVLAIDSHVGSTDSGPPPTDADAGAAVFANAIATLALDPTQAEVIVNASSMGKLTLVLRSVADTAKPEVARELAANAAIRLTSPFWAK